MHVSRQFSISFTVLWYCLKCTTIAQLGDHAPNGTRTAILVNEVRLARRDSSETSNHRGTTKTLRRSLSSTGDPLSRSLLLCFAIQIRPADDSARWITMNLQGRLLVVLTE